MMINWRYTRYVDHSCWMLTFRSLVEVEYIGGQSVNSTRWTRMGVSLETELYRLGSYVIPLKYPCTEVLGSRARPFQLSTSNHHSLKFSNSRHAWVRALCPIPSKIVKVIQVDTPVCRKNQHLFSGSWLPLVTAQVNKTSTMTQGTIEQCWTWNRSSLILSFFHNKSQLGLSSERHTSWNQIN